MRLLFLSVRQDLRRAIEHTWLNTLAGCVWVPRALRWLMWRAAGIDVRTFKLGYNVTLLTRDLHVEPGALIQVGCFFEGGPITIGRDTMIGYDVAFISADHPRDEQGRAAGQHTFLPIDVGANCWIGTRALILGGVTIANDCTVGAGSVVSRSLTVPGIYAGVPAKLIRAHPTVAADEADAAGADEKAATP